MGNSWFRFKQFEIRQEKSAFRVGTDGVLLGAWCNVEYSNRVLDIGTGTGLIALMVAQRSKALITAIEPDIPSAVEAEQNIGASPWSERITLVNTSLQQFAAGSALRFDHIVSNPPYFTGSLKGTDRRVSAARHSDTLPVAELLAGSDALLAEGGRISMVLPYTEGNILIAEAATAGLFCNRLTKVKPTPSSPVRRLLIEFSRSPYDFKSDFLVIERGARHDYTAEYRTLTGEFYLDS